MKLSARDSTSQWPGDAHLESTRARTGSPAQQIQQTGVTRTRLVSKPSSSLDRSLAFRSAARSPGPPGQAKAIFEKDSVVAELARRRGLSEWGVEDANKVGTVWEVELIQTAGVNLSPQDDGDLDASSNKAALRDVTALVHEQGRDIRDLKTENANLKASLKPLLHKEERARYIESAKTALEGVLMNQAVKYSGGNVDETTRALMHQDFHNLLLTDWRKIIDKLRNKVVQKDLRRFPSAFFDSLARNDPAFEPALKIIRSKKIARANRTRNKDAHAGGARTECEQILREVGNVEATKAKAILESLPPSCFGEEEDEFDGDEAAEEGEGEQPST